MSSVISEEEIRDREKIKEQMRFGMSSTSKRRDHKKKKSKKVS